MWNPQQAMMDRVFEEQAIMFAEFGKVSASKSEQFWELGWSSLNQHPMLQPNGSVIPFQPYKHYINTYRASAQQFILLRGLAQLYQDDAYGTIPTFPPPKHWKWVWEEELGPIETSAPALCLVPVSTHKSTAARNVCAVYWLAYNHLFPTPSNP